MPDADAPPNPSGDQDSAKRPGEAGHAAAHAPAEKTRGPGRPRHPDNLEQHAVSVPGNLWKWTRSQPEGASGLVRMLLESEKNRRSGAFYEISVAAGHQTMEVRTPFGDVTVLEMPGRGVMVLRDDDRHHAFGYLADKKGWQYTFQEDDLHGILHAQNPLVSEPARAARRVGTAKRRRPVKARL